MPLSLETLNILVVEDTVPMQGLLSSVLQSLGFKKPLMAANGVEGYELFQRYNPDLVVTDWAMEPCGGLELTRKIRTHISSPNVMAPIILITGYSSMPRVHEARDAGVTEFLVKPFTAHDISKRISYIINNPRDFISMRDYFGPDRRRRKMANYFGPKRRHTERSAASSGTWEVSI